MSSGTRRGPRIACRKRRSYSWDSCEWGGSEPIVKSRKLRGARACVRRRESRVLSFASDFQQSALEVRRDRLIMKLTSQEEYGLRCLLRIARVRRSMTIPEISAEEGISVFYAA